MILEKDILHQMIFGIVDIEMLKNFKSKKYIENLKNNLLRIKILIFY